jgi:hypothetical protein
MLKRTIRSEVEDDGRRTIEREFDDDEAKETRSNG